NLIFWDSDNFGDALNPLLIQELSGEAVQFKDVTLSRTDRVKLLVKSLFTFNFKKAKTIIFPWNSTMTAIGSILSWAKKRSVIWGSGFMNEFDEFAGGTTYAVRGKLTDRKLQQAGFSGCSVYGDPALLLPLWIKPSLEKNIKLGVIPHWKEVDYFKNNFGDDYVIIDLRTRDIYKVIEQITSCEKILSTSLHGLIVGHAYGIPSLWIKHGHIDTDGFKFHDYFSSVDIPSYSGFEDVSRILKVPSVLDSLFVDHADKANINNSLSQIQTDLLNYTPFSLKDKYKKLSKMLVGV